MPKWDGRHARLMHSHSRFCCILRLCQPINSYKYVCRSRKAFASWKERPRTNENLFRLQFHCFVVSLVDFCCWFFLFPLWRERVGGVDNYSGNTQYLHRFSFVTMAKATFICSNGTNKPRRCWVKGTLLLGRTMLFLHFLPIEMLREHAFTQSVHMYTVTKPNPTYSSYLMPCEKIFLSEKSRKIALLIIQGRGKALQRHCEQI